MMRCVILFLFCTLSLQSQGATITGQIFYFEPEGGLNRLQFAMPDYLSMKWLETFTSVDEEGRFHIQLDLQEPTECKIVLARQTQSLILSPTDSLHLTFDFEEWKKEGGKAISISGTSANRQSRLMHLEDIHYATFPEPDRNQLAQWTTEEARHFLRKQHQKKLNFWKSWEISDPLLQEYADHQAFFSLAKTYLLYANLTQKNRIRWTPSEEYFDFWPATLNYQRIRLQTFTLQQLLATYLNFLNLNLPEKIKDLPDHPEEQIPILVQQQTQLICQQDLPIAMRNRVLAMQLGNNMDFDLSLPGVDTLFANHITYPFLRKRVKTKYRALTSPPQRLRQGNHELLPPDSMTSLTAFLHQQFPGQTIVIDFWGTWCGSCLRAMREKIPTLLNDFSDQPVSFVFVASGSPKPRWIEIVNQLPYTGNHLNVPFTVYQKLIPEFGLSGLPHYAIINTAGNLVIPSAQHPGQGLKQQIEEVR